MTAGTVVKTHVCTACSEEKPVELFDKWRRQNGCRAAKSTAAVRRYRSDPVKLARDRAREIRVGKRAEQKRKWDREKRRKKPS